jgi:hypothetical protein
MALPPSPCDDDDSVATKLTVIVTTSPVPSNPSTHMLQAVVESMALVPGLTSCRKLIVCDGCKVGAKRGWLLGAGMIDIATAVFSVTAPGGGQVRGAPRADHYWRRNPVPGICQGAEAVTNPASAQPPSLVACHTRA